jgi:hypothetical protein
MLTWSKTSSRRLATAAAFAIARKYITWFSTGQMDSLWSPQSAEGKKTDTPAVDP